MLQTKFKKNYYISADGGKQDRIHKEIFFQRNDQIKQHNSNQLAHYRRELTQFSDMVCSSCDSQKSLIHFKIIKEIYASLS
jgi:hypothetical protein